MTTDNVTKWDRKRDRERDESIAMEQRLLKRIEFIGAMRGKRTREEFIEFVLYQIACYGGDETCAIMSYYGDRLDSEVNRLVKE